MYKYLITTNKFFIAVSKDGTFNVKVSSEDITDEDEQAEQIYWRHVKFKYERKWSRRVIVSPPPPFWWRKKL